MSWNIWQTAKNTQAKFSKVNHKYLEVPMQNISAPSHVFNKMITQHRLHQTQDHKRPIQILATKNSNHHSVPTSGCYLGLISEQAVKTVMLVEQLK